jgi:hypothetical protein
MLIARNLEANDTLDPLSAEILEALRFPCRGDDALTGRLRQAGWEEESLRELPVLLDQLREACLVVDPAELVREASERCPTAAPVLPGIDVLAWITADRPDLLSRSLAAWLTRLKADSDGFPEIVVADDSRRRQAETRAAVEAFARTYPGVTRFLDRDFRVRLANELERSLPSELSGSAAFALGLSGSPSDSASSCGANRNLVLLACPKRTVVMSDDDTLPDFRVHPDAADTLALKRDQGIWLRNAFASRAELEAFGIPAAGPVLGAHRRLLGASGRNLDPTASRTDLANADAALISRFFGPEPIIRALCFGSWGDSGTTSTRYLLTARHVMGLPNLSDDQYRAMSRGRLTFRAPSSVTIGKGGLMGMHLALDLREVLPPFSPYGRNQDGLWGYLFSLLHPGHEIGYPIEAIHHLPALRTGSPEQDSAAWEVCLNERVRMLLDSDGPQGDADLSPYSATGGRLTVLSGRPEKEVGQLVRQVVGDFWETQTAVLEAAYRRHGGQPALWGEAIEELHRNLLACRERGGALLPADPEADAIQSYIGDLGRLLAAWPTLNRNAAALAG